MTEVKVITEDRKTNVYKQSEMQHRLGWERIE